MTGQIPTATDHFHGYALGKGMISSFLLPVVSQTGFFSLVKQPVSKESTEFKPALLCLKIYLVSHPASGKGCWVNTYRSHWILPKWSVWKYFESSEEIQVEREVQEVRSEQRLLGNHVFCVCK